MGFRLTFSYPITRLISSYFGFADHNSVDLTPAELTLVHRIKALKAVTSLKSSIPGWP